MFVLSILVSIYQFLFSGDSPAFVPLAISLAAIILGIMQNTVQVRRVRRHGCDNVLTTYDP
jgi:hypothetical protein